MKNNVTIVEMFIGFPNIINDLQALGKVYIKFKKVKKILWSFPK